MLAKDLKQLVKSQNIVKVRVIAPPMPEGQKNLSDYGDSVSGISTYLEQGMLADIVDACSMPPMPDTMLDAKAYLDAVTAGHVYFVFRHAPYIEHNERIASTTWTNDRPEPGELAEGTAVQTGCYSGYDMIGFAPEEDMSQILEIL
jgi:hypothetical protein